MLVVSATLLALLVSGPVPAERVEALFSAEVTVEDAAEEAREAGIKEALGKVLVRVTGDREAALRPALLALIEGATGYVQSFRYLRTADGLLMAVAFDGEALQDQVAQAGIPVWGAERPAILVWLAIDYGGGRRSIVPSDSDGPVATAVRTAARDRGLPVILPLMDAKDRERISFADIWGGFTDSLEAASSRYAPDAVLVGRARRLASGRLSVDWRLQFGAEVVSERGGLGDGIEAAADYFAAQFAVGGAVNAAQSLTVEVTELLSLATYARVLGHLEGLSIVDQVRLSRMTGSAASFDLMLRGSREQLRRALALGGVLQEVRPGRPADTMGGVADLYYRPVP